MPPPLPAKGPPPLPYTSGVQSILSIEELERFGNLLLFAEAMVDGFFAGQHRSPRPGSSTEFRDYKNYVPGDPIDRVDWRAYGRTRRLVVRRYEDETDMTAYLLVDVSASMEFHGKNRPSKYVHAARLAAALAFLMIRQGDKAALGLFAEELRRFIPPGGTRRHLHEIVSNLEVHRPRFTTGLPASLKQCASAIRKRGRLVLLSDFHVPLEPLFDSLSEFLHRDFEILLLQILDPDELELPGQQVAQFVDMETGEQVQVDTGELRENYRNEMQEFINTLAREAGVRAIEHQLVRTDQPYTSALEAYLGFRSGTR